MSLSDHDGQSSPYRLRRSARVLLFEQDTGELLLIRFEAQLDGTPWVFWVTPGGEIEAGEGEREAAERELREELGLELSLGDPVHRESGGTYVHLGETVRNQDVFFAAVTQRPLPKLAGVTAEEVALMREIRWWRTTDLETTGEPVYPAQLAVLASALWEQRGRDCATWTGATGGCL